MPWHARFLPEFQIIELNFLGIVTASDLRDSLEETLRMAEADQAHRVLSDLTLIDGGHSCFDLFELGMSLCSNSTARELREAVVMPADAVSARDARFWETFCCNRGLNVRTFLDRESAIRWLAE